MNKRRVIGSMCFACFTTLSVVIATFACGEPSGEPKTPPNSPLPEIEKKEPDPKSPPKTPLPLARDGG